MGDGAVTGAGEVGAVKGWTGGDAVAVKGLTGRGAVVFLTGD